VTVLHEEFLYRFPRLSVSHLLADRVADEFVAAAWRVRAQFSFIVKRPEKIIAGGAFFPDEAFLLEQFHFIVFFVIF
jgi:hypothetical protein